MTHWHIACSIRPEEGTKHAALITIFIHQPVTEADSLFISNFVLIEDLKAGCKPHYHVGTNYRNYFGASTFLFNILPVG